MNRAFLLGILLATSACNSKPATEPVFLGMVQPLGGAQQDPGLPIRQAAQLALTDLRTEEVRVQGRDVVVLHAEAGTDARTTRAETVRLVAVNRTPALIGVLPPAQGEVFFREARLLGVPAVLAGELASPPSADGLLILGAGPPARARALASFTRTALKPTRLAVLTDERDPFAASFAAAMLSALRESPALPCEEHRYAGSESRDAAMKLLVERKPDTILLAVPPAEQEGTRRELQNRGLSATWLDGASDRDLPGPESGSEPVYRISVYGGTDLSELGKTFAQSYRERFSAEPTLSAVLSYEAIQLIVRQMSAAGSASNLRLRDLFAQPELQFEGTTGTIRFKDRQAMRKLFVVKDQNGKRTTEKIITPGE